MQIQYMLIRKENVMNNEIKFDPQTGQPAVGSPNASPLASGTPVQPQPAQQPTIQVPPIDAPVNPTTNMQTNTEIINNNINNIQQQMQSIPTVDQNKQEFLNNTNANTVVKDDNKEAKPNIAFIVI